MSKVAKYGWIILIDSKIKKKDKNTPDLKRDKEKSQEDSSGSKKNPLKKNNKGEMSK